MTVSTTTASRKAQAGIKQGFQHSPSSAEFRTPHPVSFAILPPSWAPIPLLHLPPFLSTTSHFQVPPLTPLATLLWAFPWICPNSGSLCHLLTSECCCWGGWSCTPAPAWSSPLCSCHTACPARGHRAGGAALSREEGEEIVSRHSAFSLSLPDVSALAPLLHSLYRPLQQGWKMIFYLLLNPI